LKKPHPTEAEAMSENEHESMIKTPKQLIIVVVLAFVVPVLGAALLAYLVVTGSKKPEQPSTSLQAEELAKRIKPVAEVTLEAAGGAAQAARTGEQIVQQACAACHATGAAGAPKIGDKAAWSKRIALGLDGLVKSAIAGKNAMPARGGAADLSDYELARAIVHMTNQSGGSFKEPAAPAGAGK
jgi:cytochrome c5